MEFGQTREFSEEMATRVDYEISNVMSRCYEVAMNTLAATLKSCTAWPTCSWKRKPLPGGISAFYGCW